MKCAICGTEDAVCGGPTTYKPVDIPAEVTVATGQRVQVDRGDGVVFGMRESSARKFLASHPHAFILGEGPTPDVTTMQETVTTAPAPTTPTLETMTRAEIDAYGAERGVDTTGARTKADAIEMIEASS